MKSLCELVCTDSSKC